MYMCMGRGGTLLLRGGPRQIGFTARPFATSKHAECESTAKFGYVSSEVFGCGLGCVAHSYVGVAVFLHWISQNPPDSGVGACFLLSWL